VNRFRRLVSEWDYRTRLRAKPFDFLKLHEHFFKVNIQNGLHRIPVVEWQLVDTPVQIPEPIEVDPIY